MPAISSTSWTTMVLTLSVSPSLPWERRRLSAPGPAHRGAQTEREDQCSPLHWTLPRCGGRGAVCWLLGEARGHQPGPRALEKGRGT